MKKNSKNRKENESPAGKGDKPRSCFSANYRENYNSINWDRKPQNKKHYKFTKKY